MYTGIKNCPYWLFICVTQLSLRTLQYTCGILRFTYSRHERKRRCSKRCNKWTQDLYQALRMTGTGKAYKKEVDVSNLYVCDVACACCTVCMWCVHGIKCCIPTLQYLLWWPVSLMTVSTAGMNPHKPYLPCYLATLREQHCLMICCRGKPHVLLNCTLYFSS